MSELEGGIPTDTAIAAPGGPFHLGAPLNLERTRVTNITVARQFNRGNNEFSRYEISAQVVAGDNAGAVLVQIEFLLGKMNPIPPVGPAEVGAALAFLQRPEAQDPARQQEAGRCRRLVEAFNTWQKQRLTAAQGFDQLGGVHTIEEATDKWTRKDDPR